MIKTNESIKKAAEIIRALGHPARIEILILLKHKPKRRMTVTQIHEELGLTQPETSRHLSVLKTNSVLHCEKEGSHSYYFINEEHSFIQCVANCMCK
jgi:DNA-binding transcriptional ArsR family regulator